MTLHILGTIGAGADSGGGAFGPKSVQVLPTSRADIAVRQSAGPGMSVLLLHAPASSKDAFDALFQKELASDYRMIAIDLPGHGASGEAHDPASAYTTEGYADARSKRWSDSASNVHSSSTPRRTVGSAANWRRSSRACSVSPSLARATPTMSTTTIGRPAGFPTA